MDWPINVLKYFSASRWSYSMSFKNNLHIWSIWTNCKISKLKHVFGLARMTRSVWMNENVRSKGWRARGEGEKEGRERNAREENRCHRALRQGGGGGGGEEGEYRAFGEKHLVQKVTGGGRRRSRRGRVVAGKKIRVGGREAAKRVKRQRRNERGSARTRREPRADLLSFSNEYRTRASATTIRSQGRSLLLSQSGDLSGMYYPSSRARYDDPSSLLFYGCRPFAARCK